MPQSKLLNCNLYLVTYLCLEWYTLLVHKLQVDSPTNVGANHYIKSRKKNTFLVINHADLTMLDKYESFSKLFKDKKITSLKKFV